MSSENAFAYFDMQDFGSVFVTFSKVLIWKRTSNLQPYSEIGLIMDFNILSQIGGWWTFLGLLCLSGRSRPG